MGVSTLPRPFSPPHLSVLVAKKNLPGQTGVYPPLVSQFSSRRGRSVKLPLLSFET